ncbi:VOC family protein [Candidatus Kaiserbacteria bacterium]|nr:VOC family protein [Candidatus Kaiserbacteria bacterium]
MKLVHQEIQYIEFLSPDLERIKTFYQAAFDWKFTDYGDQYTAFSGENVDGGFAVGEPVAGSILVVLYSSNIEDSLARMVEAGGTLTQDIFEFPGGRRFQFVDPDGNELAVWTDY